MGDPERGDRFLQLEERHNVFADSDLASEMAAVTGAANRVNAAIYTLDPRGVVGTTNLDRTSTSASCAPTSARRRAACGCSPTPPAASRSSTTTARPRPGRDRRRDQRLLHPRVFAVERRSEAPGRQVEVKAPGRGCRWRRAVVSPPGRGHDAAAALSACGGRSWRPSPPSPTSGVRQPRSGHACRSRSLAVGWLAGTAAAGMAMAQVPGAADTAFQSGLTALHNSEYRSAQSAFATARTADPGLPSPIGARR